MSSVNVKLFRQCYCTFDFFIVIKQNLNKESVWNERSFCKPEKCLFAAIQTKVLLRTNEAWTLTEAAGTDGCANTGGDKSKIWRRLRLLLLVSGNFVEVVKTQTFTSTESINLKFDDKDICASASALMIISDPNHFRHHDYGNKPKRGAVFRCCSLPKAYCKQRKIRIGAAREAVPTQNVWNI